MTLETLSFGVGPGSSRRLFLIKSEYEKENTSLGGVSDGHPDELYQQRSTPFVHVLNKLLGDLPMVSLSSNTRQSLK